MLLKCWLNSYDCLELPNYSNYIFPRTSGKGSCIAIFVKCLLELKVSIVYQYWNTIVWLLFENPYLYATPIYMYLAAFYIPPESIVFYKKEKVDIFQYIEETYCDYFARVQVYITGDFYARCGPLEDFIVDDVWDQSLANI